MNFEVELKFKIDNTIWNKILPKLPKNAIIKVTNETDTYYDEEDSFKLTIQDKALRIRKTVFVDENSKNPIKEEITYKGPKMSSESKTRRELNLIINDSDGFDSLFRELNFKPIMNVNKIRTTYIFTIEEKIEVKLSLDNVKDLGLFIELESFSDRVESITFIENKLKEFWINLLKLSEVPDKKSKISIRESYLELLKKNSN